MRKQSADRVLESYIELCMQVGLPAVTLQKAAKHAGVPFATAHYSWGGKRKDLIVGALEKVGKGATEYIVRYLQLSEARGEDPLQAYVKGTFRWIREYPEHAQLWLYSYYHAATLRSVLGSPRYSKTTDFVLVATKRVQELIERSVSAGHMHAPKDPEKLAEELYGLLVGNGVLAVTLRSEKRLRELEAATRRGFSRLGR